jgi:hypothetical protein
LPYHRCGTVKSRPGLRRHRRLRGKKEKEKEKENKNKKKEEEKEEKEEKEEEEEEEEEEGGPRCLPGLGCLATYIGYVPRASICLCWGWYLHHHTILWKH